MRWCLPLTTLIPLHQHTIFITGAGYVESYLGFDTDRRSHVYLRNMHPSRPPSLLATRKPYIMVMPQLTDFLRDLDPVKNFEIKGIASGLQVKGSGTVSYKYYNDHSRNMSVLFVCAKLYSTPSLPSSARCLIWNEPWLLQIIVQHQNLDIPGWSYNHCLWPHLKATNIIHHSWHRDICTLLPVILLRKC